MINSRRLFSLMIVVVMFCSCSTYDEGQEKFVKISEINKYEDLKINALINEKLGLSGYHSRLSSILGNSHGLQSTRVKKLTEVRWIVVVGTSKNELEKTVLTIKATKDDSIKSKDNYLFSYNNYNLVAHFKARKHWGTLKEKLMVHSKED